MAYYRNILIGFPVLQDIKSSELIRTEGKSKSPKLVLKQTCLIVASKFVTMMHRSYTNATTYLRSDMSEMFGNYIVVKIFLSSK